MNHTSNPVVIENLDPDVNVKDIRSWANRYGIIEKIHISSKCKENNFINNICTIWFCSKESNLVSIKDENPFNCLGKGIKLFCYLDDSMKKSQKLETSKNEGKSFKLNFDKNSSNCIKNNSAGKYPHDFYCNNYQCRNISNFKFPEKQRGEKHITIHVNAQPRRL